MTEVAVATTVVKVADALDPVTETIAVVALVPAAVAVVDNAAIPND